MMSSSDEPKDSGSEKSTPTRRQFIRDLGGALFIVTIVDALSVGALADTAACSRSTGTDNNCAVNGAQDGHCGYTNSPPTTPPSTDADQNCSATDNDQNCKSGHADKDESCSPGTAKGTTFNEDGNCNAPVQNQPNDTDDSCSVNSADESCGSSGSQDEHCSQFSSDAACSPPGPTGTGYDQDQSCTQNGADADQSCNVGGIRAVNNPDPDNHCGQPLSDGSTDPDNGTKITAF